MVLRKSLFLSSVLLNSEAWVNYTEKEVRILEQCDEILLSNILECDGKSSNAFKYLELGIIPIRFEIMKRKIMFLQYILRQEKNSMVYKIFKAMEDNPIKNDFVYTCKKYLEILKINTNFEEIGKMSKFTLKQILREKTKFEALVYLKSQQMVQEKIKNIVYRDLKMQDYLFEGDRNLLVSKAIYKARGQILDIKMHKRWKFDNLNCEGCNKNLETGEEILQCEKLGTNEDQATYTWFYSELVTKQILAGKVLLKKLKKRKQIREEIT